MKALVELCLRQRYVVVGLALLSVALGVVVTGGASFDAFPEFAPPRVEVQTEAPGLSSEEVEALVTTPLEGVLAGTPSTQELRSKSVLGLSSVVLVFEPGTDLLEARALVAERVARAPLPVVARPPVVLSPLSSTSRVLKIGVWSAEHTQMELSDLIRWVVRPRLMSVPGVANVAIWGERTRQLQVLVDPERLQASATTLDALLAVSREAVTPRSGGFVDTTNQRLAVQYAPVVRNTDELAAVPVREGLAVGDVAEVVEGHPPAIGEALVTRGVGLLLIAEKQPGANTLEVTRGLEAALEELAPGLPGIELDTTIFRPAGFIERALANLAEAMLIGTSLVILILILFLWDWRTAVISVVAIPLSLLAASTILTLLGRTLDTMVIAGLIIALGEVVDDAIIDVENIHRRLRECSDRSPSETLKIVLSASLEVRSAVVYATMIVVLVFAPVLVLPGVAGEFFVPLALGYGLAVFASMLVALTLTPTLALLLLPNHIQGDREPILARRLRAQYRRLLASVLRRPKRVLASSATVVVMSMVGLAALDQAFLPDFAENDFLMHWIGKPGTSLEAMARSADLAREELLAIPGVRNYGAHIGRAEVADEVVGPNFGELWVSVDPNADLEATLSQVQAVVDGYPGIYRDVQTYLQERMREVLSGGSGAIVVRVFGPGLEELRRRGRALASELEALDGVRHASPEAQVDVPQIVMSMRLDRCAALAVDPGTVRRQASVLLQGERVGTIVRGQQPIDVVVWGVQKARRDVEALRALMLDAGSNRIVRLEDVADVRVGPVPNTIAHHGGSRKLDVTIELEPGADLGALARSVEDLVRAHPFEAGYHAETLGEHVARQDAQRTLLAAGALALIGVFLILLADFSSFRMAALVMLSLPLALVGAVIAIVLTGGVVSLGTLVGLVTVMGIASRNGILLIAHYRHLEEVEKMPFGLELLLRGASERLAPIVMTALSTGLALVPLAVAGHTAGHEIEHPMAIVILGGLVSSTLLNLFAMPVVVFFSRRPQLRSEVGATP
ncbi:MAG: efflux RND transporter permease subunit [Deltaproteobacteria bacterium]|jgi:CzcA family heavy metal efflux pump